MCRQAQPTDTQDSIQLARKKLRNLEFLEGCLYSEIEKLEVKYVFGPFRNSQPMTTVVASRYELAVTEYDTVTSNVEHLALKIRQG